MTVQEWQARSIERQANLLAHTLKATPADRLAWKPAGEDGNEGRSALEQVAEVSELSRVLAALFSGGTPMRTGGQPGDAATAASEVMESASLLAAAVRGMDEGAIDRTYETPFGPLAGSVLLDIAASHMAYHNGQINYIQTLYGDREFHFPES